jgi:hypothetical protein
LGIGGARRCRAPLFCWRIAFETISKLAFMNVLTLRSFGTQKARPSGWQLVSVRQRCNSGGLVEFVKAAASLRHSNGEQGPAQRWRAVRWGFGMLDFWRG